MKLYGIRIFVDDIDIAKSFYGDTLNLPINWEMQDLKAIGFNVGSEIIVEEGSPPSAGSENLVGRFVGLSLQVDNIDEVYKDLSGKGVDFQGPPEQQPWGGKLAHFKDPSGNTLTLLG